MNLSSGLDSLLVYTQRTLKEYRRKDALEISGVLLRTAATKFDDEREKHEESLADDPLDGEAAMEADALSKFTRHLETLSSRLRRLARLVEGYGDSTDDGTINHGDTLAESARLEVLDNELDTVKEDLKELIRKIKQLNRISGRPSRDALSRDQAGGEGHPYRRDAVAEIAEYGRPSILPRTPGYGSRRPA